MDQPNDLPPGASPETKPAKAKAKAKRAAGPKAEASPSAQSREVDLQHRQVTLPSLQGLNGYASRNIYVRLDTQQQAETCRNVLAGLQDARATLANGKFVRSPADVFKYALEQLGRTDAVSQS
ncbi:MAG: hypothetical protein AAGJ40_02830 [Planctomycetota bacterium]